MLVTNAHTYNKITMIITVNIQKHDHSFCNSQFSRTLVKIMSMSQTINYIHYTSLDVRR